MRDEPKVDLNVPDFTLIRYHKKCCYIKTPGQWPWKLESAKECVTTHLANVIALKINGAASVKHIINRRIKFVDGPACKHVCRMEIQRVADAKETKSDLVWIMR